MCDIHSAKEDGTPLIETEDKWGDMNSELRPTESISEFVNGGPKNYAYRVLNGDGREKTVCKVRGIRFMILRENKGEEPSVVHVHTEKTSNVR